MATRLLEKQEIAQKKSNEKRLEIDEGLKLARKVDSLRETAAVEEAKLKKFRDESLRQIKSEITPWSRKLEDIKANVLHCEERRRKALEPITREMEELKSTREAITRMEDEAYKRTVILTDREEKIKEKEDDIKIQLRKIETKEAKADEHFENSEKALAESKQVLADASQKARTIVREAKDRENEIITREAQVAVREREAMLREDANARKTKELNDRERFINDKYETLLRTEQRLKNNG